MQRGSTRKQIVELIRKIRATIPEVVIRTSFIVGFPGETEEDFEELLGFMRETKFERLGIFRYSQEEGSPAAELPDQLPEKISSSHSDDDLGAMLSQLLLDAIPNALAVAVGLSPPACLKRVRRLREMKRGMRFA